MARRSYPSDFIPQLLAFCEAWKQITPPFTIGDLTPQKLETLLAQIHDNQAQMDALDAQLVDRRNHRDDMYLEVSDIRTRVRAGVKAAHGGNSSQYEMVGGTRTSERKSPTRHTPNEGTHS